MSLLSLNNVLNKLQSDLGLTSKELIGALGTTPLTFRRWLAGESFPQLESRARLDCLGALRNDLYDTFASQEDVIEWLHLENTYLGKFTPAEVLSLGRIERVDIALKVLEQGIYV